MKILFLTPWYPDEKQPNHGVFIRDQVRALADAGHEVRVVAAKIDYNRFGIFRRSITTETDQNIQVHQLRISRSLPVFNQVNFFLICRRETLRIIRDFKPDIIHGNIGYPGACWSWLVSIASGIPYVITEHTLLHNNFRSPVHRLLTVACMKRAAALITVSRYSAAVIRKYTSAEARVVPNLVDFSLFAHIHPFPSAPPIRVGFLGSSFFIKKGLDTLLKALTGVPEIELHIGGFDPEEHERFVAMVDAYGLSDRCIFHGKVLRADVPEFMSRLHFFVSPSVFESFGISIAEAMACGLPVVCTNSGGPADFVDDTSGLLVPVGDVEQLRAGLQQMCRTYMSYDRDTIRETVIRRFHGKVIAAEIEKIYRGVLWSE